MADLPTNADILRDYFDSDDDSSEFEGFRMYLAVMKMTMNQANLRQKMNDRASEPAMGARNFDKLYKVREVLTMAHGNFKNNYRPHQNMAIDEAMIKRTGRLSYKQYLPAKPIKRGIKYHVYFDNYFTSVKLMEDLLAQKIYPCGTVRTNRRGFPNDLKGRLRMQRGESKIRQKGNLTASVWQDKKPVAFLSTLSYPRLQVPMTRQNGRQVLQLTQPHAANEYNKYMNGVDRHDQLTMKYPLERDSKKAWKYIFHFMMNCAIVNAFIMFTSSSQRRNSQKRFTHVDFRMELAHHLIASFVEEKGNLHKVQMLLLTLKTLLDMNLPTWVQNVGAMFTPAERKEKKLFMGAKYVMYICVKMDATLHTIIDNENEKTWIKFDFVWHLNMKYICVFQMC
ncbi:piggyBac transposable element-derived protein 4-like [Ostrea edulis]|uniref:piggyBac transposable element-derived protein 4-like n=1 Tax=Ostrea edulis TaxID=37623 RepID=UPI0024AFE4C2|nr:piggyBac transposable element-derived protein 4-like [Ostrea edulis]